ncbi:MAG: hypothetical protein HQK79_08185 [Desulfobacterales bacterium]|nr:hypothetical protein [Desulfobacterales bacterium]
MENLSFNSPEFEDIVVSTLLSPRVINIFSDVMEGIVEQKFRKKIPEEFDSQSLKSLIGATIVSRLEQLKAEMATMKGDVSIIKEKLNSVESRLGSVESRLGSVESRLGSVESKMVTKDELKEGLKDTVNKVIDGIKPYLTR